MFTATAMGIAKKRWKYLWIFQGMDNSVLLLTGQIGRHGKAQTLGSHLFGYRKIAGFVAQAGKCALKVQWGGVVGDRRDLLCLQRV